MIESIQRIFSVQELRKKIFFTLALLAVCRLGAFIPVPGIDGDAAVRLFRYTAGGGRNLFQLLDIFSGGAFAHMTIVALGVMPYISASIVTQLLLSVMPSFQREMKENSEQGRKKMGKWTRGFTLLLSLIQSTVFIRYALQLNASHPGIILPSLLQFQAFGIPWLFYFLASATMTTGTLFLMWIGEQITEKGIGNGMSLIITVGILSSIPSIVGSIFRQLNLDSQAPGQLNLSSLLLLACVFVVIIVGTILIIQGQRKIPLQYARRVVGRHEVQGGNAFIPLKINYAGVIPVIFASSLLMFPATLARFASQGTFLSKIAFWLSPGSAVYTTLYILLIIFFTYFWTATQFHPDQIASDMKKNGAFIPGVKQGKPTKDFLESTMNQITLVGALSLALIAILPTLVSKFLHVDANISHFFGGTSLLILVGVVLDTTKQIESHLITKRYDGFMTKKKVRVKM